MRQTGRFLLLSDSNEQLLILERQRRHQGKPIRYYAIPGGGIMSGETPVQAATREINEELGLLVKSELYFATQSLPTQTYLGRNLGARRHHYFLAHCDATQAPMLNPHSEEWHRMQTGDNSYAPLWIPLTMPLEQFHADYRPIVTLLKSYLKGEIASVYPIEI